MPPAGKRRCRVHGCGYLRQEGYVRQHEAQSMDPAHVAWRKAREGAQERPEPEPEPQATPEAQNGAQEAAQMGSSAVVVDLGPERGALADAPLIAADEPMPATSPEEAPAKPAPAAAEGEAEPTPDELAAVFVDAPAGTAAPARAYTPIPRGTGSAAMEFGLGETVNRFALGALNNWALDVEAGDVPVTREEVAQLGIPQTLGRIIDWLEHKYGWVLDLDHPIVHLTLMAVQVGILVKRHKREEDEGGGLEEGEQVAAEVSEGPAPARTQTEPARESSAFSAQLDRLVGPARRSPA